MNRSCHSAEVRGRLRAGGASISRLLLIRHGQATYVGEAADQLTALGREQGRLLGEAWASGALRPDRVFVGPLGRQAQTVQAVVDAFEALGVALPEPEVEPALDEYPALEILKRAAEGPQTAATVQESIGLVMRRYVRGELAYDDIESFARFRQRVSGFLDRVQRESGRGQVVAAFTSGGPVAAAVGQVLDLSSEKVLELTWTIRNGAITELLFRPDRAFSLVAFNSHPHLDEDRLLTYR